jgi:penicillin G amidase
LRSDRRFGAARLALRLALAGLRHRPRRLSLEQRLTALPRQHLPVEQPVEIRWNDRLVPFIDARSDRDLAVALGLVHAHLRLAQIELLRRIAQGRLAEILGPVAIGFDHALRLLDPARAVPAILQMLPNATRDWLDGFVAGINHYLAHAEAPLEYRLLGVSPEPWTPADILGVARLAAADVNWLLWMRLLPILAGPDWPASWAALIADGTAPLPSLGSGRADPADGFVRLVLGLGHAGSNAVAVAGRRSATGQAWLAGDPHLSLSLPSVWLQAAYRSPSYNVAGLMIPGIPVMAIGRNRSIAWGGTNLHAASSELFDVSELPASDIAERPARIAVRWSRPCDIRLRDSAYGPIISDAPLFGGGDGRALALRWVGHQPSDELSALLAVNRAQGWAEFRRAATAFAVPGQTLVYADESARVGRLHAAWLPRRAATPPADMVSPRAAAALWSEPATAADFPTEIDPPRGFVVSANDRPPEGEVPLGWFFAPNDRAERLSLLLRASERIGQAELAELQRDVAAPAAVELRDQLCAALDPTPQRDGLLGALAGWDGRYAADSAGALAFELVLARLAAAVTTTERRALYAAVWHGRRLLARDIDGLPTERLTAALHTALAAARPAFARLRRWGGAHRLRLAHPLGAMPLVGRRYRPADWPWPGSNDTVFKSAHGLVAGRHAVAYGSNARYLFDLSDPDGNHLVLLGGQDGVPGSPAFVDQAELFRRGEYVTVPLQAATARRLFPHVTRLAPARPR